MGKLKKPGKVKTIKKDICMSLHRNISKLQNELQREWNIKYGRKAGNITYGYASSQYNKRFCK